MCARCIPYIAGAFGGLVSRTFCIPVLVIPVVFVPPACLYSVVYMFKDDSGAKSGCLISH